MNIKLNIFLVDVERPIVLTSKVENSFQLEEMVENLKDCVAGLPNKKVKIKTETDIFLSIASKISAIIIHTSDKHTENINFDDINITNENSEIIMEEDGETILTLDEEDNYDSIENSNENTSYSLDLDKYIPEQENNELIENSEINKEEEIKNNKRGRKKKENSEESE